MLPQTRRIRGFALAALAASLAFVTACPKQEDFPAALDVIVPPTPEDFVITNPQDNDYDLNWTISDPGDVKNYRLYLVGLGLAPELLAEPTTTTYPITLPFDAGGLQFGLSAVSTDNVEGAMVVATVP